VQVNTFYKDAKFFYLLENAFFYCRFVILKAVQRKDLIETLPLPRRLIDYLQNKNFLSELIESDSSSQSQVIMTD